MKKIYILFCLAVTLVTASKSQNMVASSDGLVEFFGKTLYVPVTGNKAFDDALQNGFSKYWKVTPYKLVEYKEYSKLLKEKDKNVELFSKNTGFLFEWYTDYFQIYGICKAYSFWGSTERLIESHWIDGTDFFAKSKQFDYVRYRIEYIVKAMNDIIIYTRDNKLGNDAKHNTWIYDRFDNDGNRRKKIHDFNIELSKFINTNAKIIKDKTLILNKDMASPRSRKGIYAQEEFAQNYPYPYKFVSEAEFNEILKGEQKEYVCYIPSYYTDNHHWLAYEFVYEPATKSTIYMGQSEKFSNIGKEEIEELKRAIK